MLYMRDLAMNGLSVRLSVCLLVCHMLVLSQTKKRRIMRFLHSCSPGTLAFETKFRTQVKGTHIARALD